MSFNNKAGSGITIEGRSTEEDALRRLSKSNFYAILLDLKLPGISEMDVLKLVTESSNYWGDKYYFAML